MNVSTAPATASRRERQPQARGHREPGEGRAPHGDRGQHGPAVPDDVPDRAGQRRADQAAHADGRGEQAERARMAAEPFRVDGREEGDGQPEHGGVEVDQERPGQRLAAPDEPDALGDRTRAGAGARAGARAAAASRAAGPPRRARPRTSAASIR